MLGNKDFAKMLSGSGLNFRSVENNKRKDSSFDLKNTISQWDKDQKHKETM